MVKHPHDGPAQALLQYIGAFDFVKPHDWKGVRLPISETIAPPPRRSTCLVGVETIFEHGEESRGTVSDGPPTGHTDCSRQEEDPGFDVVRILSPRTPKADQRDEWS